MMFEKLTQRQARTLYILLGEAATLSAKRYHATSRTPGTRARADARQYVSMVGEFEGLRLDLRPAIGGLNAM